MSQEIQLSLPSNNLPQQANAWGMSGSTALGPVSHVPPTPLAKMHQHLRGRYILTVLFALVGAGAGAAAGVILPHPSYQSVGIIKIDPRIPSPELTDRIMPLWQAYVVTVVQNFHSERVIKAAMESDDWKRYRPLPPDAYFAGWTKNLTVKLVPNSFDITVTYADDSKDGKVVAPIAVRSLINAYVELYGDEEKKDLARKESFQKAHLQTKDQEIANYDNDIAKNLLDDGGDLQKVYEAKFSIYLEYDKERRRLDADLHQNQERLKQAQEQQGTTPPTIEDFARVDPAMRAHYDARIQEEIIARDLETRFGKNNPGAIGARAKVTERTQAMETYRDELNSKYIIRYKVDGTSAELVQKSLDLEINAVRRANEVCISLHQELMDLSQRCIVVSKLRSKKTIAEEDRRRTALKIEELGNEIDMANNMEVIDPGGQSAIGSDKRIAFGTIGFLAGAGMPVGLMLLMSLMNPRFRYSDEATGQTASGLTLLGILPDLPDRLSDPEQASIAAHCVHQIRTMLQINNGTDERRVFAVTSAAPGDGKTSLTLALGLSYAACGTRTLLVDCDLIGSGLTSRLNVSSADGVLEAIAHRSLLEFVRNTDIADVSILPVGTGQGLHASTLSPAALRRLIEEAKKHFDTILIDTGPVLGSIEASLVAAAADAVVLTVSRGQQRPLVEKTVQHLKNIKANLAGVVFNRAQTSDFDGSISGLSLRSHSRSGNGHSSVRMGPVARAVQSAFKPAGEDVN